MAKFCSTVLIADALEILATRVSRICVCGTNVTTSITAANCTSTASVGFSDGATCTKSGGTLTINDATAGKTGKKIDVSAVSGIACNKTGNIGGVALISTGASGILYWFTTCAEQTVSSTSNTVNIAAYTIYLSDAT